jgi:hypothetical protein
VGERGTAEPRTESTFYAILGIMSTTSRVRAIERFGVRGLRGIVSLPTRSFGDDGQGGRRREGRHLPRVNHDALILRSGGP